jgi:Flp pilus assembly pilin Flp
MNRHLIVRDHVESASDRITASGDRGAALVEYVLLVGLIFLVCLASVTAFGDGVSDNVDNSASRVVTASGQSYGG